jgi:cell division protein FtsB
VKGRRVTSSRHWLAFGGAILLSVMLCLTVNFRALSVMNQEMKENSALETQIQAVTSENLALQEEIHYLKNDPDTIEREAKKFGLSRPKNKVSVPVAR